MSATHLVAEPGDRRSLCGVKDALPVVLTRHADAHVRGYGITVCPDCQAQTVPVAPRLRVGSVFAGIGGFDLAFERAGAEVIWNCEVDVRCRTVLRKHWPGIPRFKDVRTVTGAGLRTASLVPDVLVGGFPCQDLSVAGARAGLAGERSGLFFEFARLLEEIKPAWCIIENVPGLLSSAGGRDMGTVLAALVDLGYGVAWRVLDAQYFGVAQRRRRVFIVGCAGDEARAAQVLLEPEGSVGDPPARRAAGQEIAGAAAGGAGRRGYAVNGGADCASTFGTNAQGGLRTTDLDSVGAYIVEPLAFQWWAGGKEKATLQPSENLANPVIAEKTQAVAYSVYPESGQGADLRATECDVAPAISVTDGERVTDRGVRIVQAQPLDPPEIVAQAVSSKWHKGSSGPAGDEHHNLVAMAYRKATKAHHVEDWERWEEAEQIDAMAANGMTTAATAVVQVAYSMRADAMRDGVAKTPSADAEGRVRLRDPGLGIYEEVAPTVDTGQAHGVMGCDLAVRRLTPLECCRLQGFPDDWLDGLDLPDSAKYRMLGNAVAVPVVEWIARRLISEHGR